MLYHIIAGFLITVSSSLLIYHFTLNEWISCLIGFLLGIITGLFKEYIWDKKWGKGVFNIWDAINTTWGSILGIVTSIILIGCFF